jgi:putative nucleotidyltransferase with HDIG domain
VSTIPRIALRVVAVTKDPDASTRELQAVVESDPGLMVRCLRVVNSASHGIRHKVTCIRQAISLLGFRKIRDIALTNAVVDVFRKEFTIGPYRRLGLWSHMVATATCSEIITRESGVPGCEDAYVAGLLHDFGIIAEDQYAPKFFPALITNLTDSEELSPQEQTYLGFDHTVLGSRIAEKWGLPKAIGSVIRFHHMPQNYRGNDGAIVNVVAVANSIVSDCLFPSVGLNIVTCPGSAFDALGLDLSNSTYQLGAKLDFDPESEKFVDNAEANKLLTREYREPFVVTEEV